MKPSVSTPLRALLPTVVAVLIATACGSDAPPPVVGADPHLTLQQAMEKGTMDFARVTIVRLQRAGQRIEVASVAPTVITRAQLGSDEAKTIFRISDKGDALVLFSRDLPARSSFRTELSLSSLREGMNFEFPVVGPDGRPAKENFTVEKIIVAAQ